VKRNTPRRLGITAAVALGAVVAFAAIGGTGLAGGKPSKAQYAPGQYKNPGKVTICHKGKVTIRISVRALPAHTAHGDQVGSCAALTAKAKAAAKKAAKANAAKANAQAKAEKEQEKAAKKAGESAASSSTVSTPGNGNGKAKGKNKG
jgi:hypothetical protein